MSDTYVRTFIQSPERFFESGFTQIANTRMRGLPIVNPRLHVRALGFERFMGQWFGVVVTPWSILAILACADPHTWQPLEATRSRTVKMPSGEYEFVGMDDPLLGRYLACRLMSPLLDVPDQRTAEAIALQALRLMKQPVALEHPEEVGMALKVDPSPDFSLAESLDRRTFLRGGRSS